MHGMEPHEEIDYWRERAKKAEAESDRLRASEEELSKEHMRCFYEYKQRRNDQFAAYEKLLDEHKVLRAEFDAARAAVTAECVDHSELNGHIEITEQCHDHLGHIAMDNGDPTGKLSDFAASLYIVVNQLDRQRRRANWYEAAYEAGKGKLIECAVEKATVELRAEIDVLRQECRERERAAEVSAKLLTDQRDEARAELERQSSLIAQLDEYRITRNVQLAEMRSAHSEACDIAAQMIDLAETDDEGWQSNAYHVRSRIAELRKVGR